MKKKSSKNSILSYKAENFYFQVKFINCYLREIIRFTKKIDIRDWGQSNLNRKYGLILSQF